MRKWQKKLYGRNRKANWRVCGVCGNGKARSEAPPDEALQSEVTTWLFGFLGVYE